MTKKNIHKIERVFDLAFELVYTLKEDFDFGHNRYDVKQDYIEEIENSVAKIVWHDYYHTREELYKIDEIDPNVDK